MGANVLMRPDGQDPLRQLCLLALEADLSLTDKVAQLLELGCQTLDLELGIVSSIDAPVYTCLHVHGPDWAPGPGATFDVNGTYCLHTLNNDSVTGFYHAGQQEISDHPCYRDFGLESYIGAPLLCDGALFGTLNFSARAARPEPFSGEQMEFVAFLSRWLGNELKLEAERRDLREQRSLLNTVVDAMPEAVIMADPQRQVVIVNPAAEKLFGYDKKQILGRQTSVLCEEIDDYEKLAGKFAPGANIKNDDFLLSCRRADGTTFEGAISAAKVTTDAGENLGHLGVIRDVTEKKRFERQKDQLIATVSHELKTPITSLYGALRMLAMQSGTMPEQTQRLIDLAERNAESIKYLVSELLDVEKLRAVEDPHDFTLVPLAPLLRQSIETLAPYAADRSVNLRLEKAKNSEPLLRLHSERVIRLVSNLASNAIKAAPAHSIVTLGMAENGAGFWVSDKGPGIPADLQPVLFERFSRAQNYRVEEGTGLGMSIVRAIVDQHLGDIRFETGKNTGTTFYVDFPVPADTALKAAAS